MPIRTRSPFVRYAIALAFALAATGLKLLLIPLISQDTPFLVSFAAVLLAAQLGGFGPGMFVVLVTAALNAIYFMQPFGVVSITLTQGVQTLLFVVEGIAISWITAHLQSARDRAEINDAEARKLERRILEVTDAEQRRIGHDLHDGLGQHLTGIALIARRLQQRLSDSAHAEDAKQVGEMTKAAVAWTHDLCHALSPPVLDSEGLAAALRELAANAEKLFSITCLVESPDPAPTIPIESAVHLYRIAQEAISNAVRHGKATRIAISLERSGNESIVRIADNGTGLRSGSVESSGMGLRIMRYRGQIIGATVELARSETGGVEVVCRLATTI